MRIKSKTWFTADWHLFHTNIIKYCKRPFSNADEMNECILDNLNSMVQEDDVLYFLGDMALTSDPNLLRRWLRRVNCRHLLVIQGNHDRVTYQVKDKFRWYRNFEEVYVYGKPITLCHYALRVWNKSHHGAWHLYGHSHGTLPDDPNALSMDVGVDTNNFKPYSYEEIEAIMATKSHKAVDHHQS